MSQITNVISTVFRVQGGNVVSTMNQYGAGIQRFGTQLNQATRMSERFAAQWRAIGTTLRYSIAGGAVFGAAQMVPQLRDLQRQVGLISELSDQNSTNVIRNQEQVRESAIRAVTPINDFNEGLINFYSSVGTPPPQNEAVRMLEDISLSAQMAQTQVPEVSKAVTGMLNVFGTAPNLQNVQRYTRMITDLINQVPGGEEAARQIMQQFPTIASPVHMARGTPYQVFGLYETLLRTGGTPAQHGRGLAFLTQTIGNLGQQTKDTQAAWRSIGVTPEVVQQVGVAGALMTAIREVRERGLGGANRGLNARTDEMLDQLGEGAQPAEALGLTGEGARLLGALNPRIHAAREMALMVSHFGQVNKDLDRMRENFEGSADASERYKRNIDRYTSPQHLMRAQIALQGLQQQVMLGLSPVLNLASDQVVRAGRYANENPRRTRNLVVGGAAMLAALGIGRAVGAGRFPILNRIPGVRNILGAGGQALVRANAIQAAMTNTGVLGASPQNPVYVTVVGQLFGGGGGGPGTPGGGGGGTPPIITTGGRAAGRLGRLGRYSRFARGAGGMGTLVTAGALLVGTERGRDILDTPLEDVPGNINRRLHVTRPRPRPQIHEANRRELARAQALFGRSVVGAEIERRKDVYVSGQAAVTLNLNLQRDGRITKRTVAIPIDLWAGGKAPTSRAGKTARR